MQKTVGLYVHVPFCAVKCPYCDFYSLAYRRETAEAYTAALAGELLTWECRGYAADSLYFGGGTPSLLSPSQLGRITNAAHRAFSLNGEVTMEANPNTVNAGRLAGYRAAGINRISFGMQSGSPRELAALGRKHSAGQALHAVELAFAAGIGNISLDLMLGIPGQTEESLTHTFSLLDGFPLSHLSAYLLKVEEATPYYGSSLLEDCPGEDEMADLYLLACASLERMGLGQYEISNFARPGRESLHNLKYWRCEEYLGFGPAAHSFLEGKRFCRPPDLTTYLAAPEKAMIETDGGAGGPEERIMLGLRLTEGIPLSLLDKFSAERKAGFLSRAAQLVQAGLARLTPRRLVLTRKGFLVNNSILLFLFEEIRNEWQP